MILYFFAKYISIKSCLKSQFYHSKASGKSTNYSVSLYKGHENSFFAGLLGERVLRHTEHPAQGFCWSAALSGGEEAASNDEDNRREGQGSPRCSQAASGILLHVPNNGRNGYIQSSVLVFYPQQG